MDARPRKDSHSRQTTARHLWLASLGLARVVQRKVAVLGGHLFEAATDRAGKRRQSR